MAIRHYTYLDIDPEVRHKAAKDAKERMRGMMMDPSLTPEQRVLLEERVRHLASWEAGELPVLSAESPEVTTTEDGPADA